MKICIDSSATPNVIMRSEVARPMTKTVLAAVLVSMLSSPLPQDIFVGSITGQVIFTDVPPDTAVVKVSKDQDYCGETLPNDAYITESNGGLKNVVVFIEAAPSAPPKAERENILDNTGCR
jgi:hypothetical protein